MDSYEVFVTVVESGNFAAAAKRLGVTSSAVSKQISRLEKRLGVQLLTRSTRSLSMTESGTMCYERSREVLDQLNDMESRLNGFQDQPTGVLKVTCSPAFADKCLIGLLADFRKEYPDISLEIKSSGKVEDIVREGIEIAIREGDLNDSNLIARKLASYRTVICASPEYLRGRQVQTIEDILAEQLILIDKTKVIKGLEGFLGVNAATPKNVILRLSHMSAIRNALLSGLGISIVPEYVVADDLAQGHLVELEFDNQLPRRDMHAVFSANRPVPAKTRAFIDFLVENLGRLSTQNFSQHSSGELVCS